MNNSDNNRFKKKISFITCIKFRNSSATVAVFGIIRLEKIPQGIKGKSMLVTEMGLK